MSTRATRLTILCRGATQANHDVVFSSQGRLLSRERAALEAIAARSPRFNTVWHAPDVAAEETATAFSENARSCPALRDVDYGCWNELNLSDVATRWPEALQRWIEDPESAPHGGETLSVGQKRAREWVSGELANGGHTLAVTHSMIFRLIFLDVVDAPLSSLWKISAAPLATMTLTSDGRRWALASFNGTRNEPYAPSACR
ncbi:histidine phosphatase family protein [Agrobacterium sp. NPDC090273]|uniref:histidine phosphatase family protein n=1 Tax=Agrobacterium sp. NPDC090273 TaxID=3363919 RepID=UPI003839D1A4